MTTDSMTDPKTCEWLKIQTAALKEDPASDEEIKLSVLEAQRLSVKLPVVRKVARSVTVTDAEGKKRSLQKDQIVICDVVCILKFTLCPIRFAPRHGQDSLIRVLSTVPRLPPQRRFQHCQRLSDVWFEPQRRSRRLQRQRDSRPRSHSHDQSPRADEESPPRPRHPRHAQKDQHRPDLRRLCEFHGP